jgi:hypothetical protein
MRDRISHTCKITGKVIVLYIAFEVFTAVAVKNNTVTWQLKAGRAQREKTAVARRRHGKNLSAATNAHATTEEALGHFKPTRCFLCDPY